MAPAQITAHSPLTTRLDGALLYFGFFSTDTPVDSTWLQSWGKVRSTSTQYLPELPRSNNTGELKALIELFDSSVTLPSRPGDTLIISVCLISA